MPGSFRHSTRPIAQAYRENYETLYRTLQPRLKPDMNVFTHNPWGEYGHEDHVQVFRVLDRLRDEIGFKLWMSNYCTERSMPLAMQYFSRKPVKTTSGCRPIRPSPSRLPPSIATRAAGPGAMTGSGSTTNVSWKPHRSKPEGGGFHLLPMNLFNFGTVVRRAGQRARCFWAPPFQASWSAPPSPLRWNEDRPRLSTRPFS